MANVGRVVGVSQVYFFASLPVTGRPSENPTALGCRVRLRRRALPTFFLLEAALDIFTAFFLSRRVLDTFAVFVDAFFPAFFLIGAAGKSSTRPLESEFVDSEYSVRLESSIRSASEL